MAVAAGRRPFYYLVDLATATVERVIAPPSFLSSSSSSGGGGGGGGGGRGGAGMKSLESFAVSPNEEQPMVAFLGDGGAVSLVSLRSRQAVGVLKMSGSARAGAFTADGQYLLTSGE